MWSENPKIDIISSKMSQLGYHVHSGSSFCFIMRKMQIYSKKWREKFQRRVFEK